MRELKIKEREELKDKSIDGQSFKIDLGFNEDNNPTTKNDIKNLEQIKEQKKNAELASMVAKEIDYFKKNNALENDFQNKDYNDLINKKAAIKHLKVFMDNKFKEELPKKYSIFTKIKNIFSKKNDSFVLTVSSAVGTFFLLSSAFILTSLVYRGGFFWSLISLIGVSVISLASINYLHEKINKDIIEEEKNKVLDYYNLSEDDIYKIKIYMDENDLKKITSLLENKGVISLQDVDNILKQKEVWVNNNEKNITEEIKKEKLQNILNN